MQPNMGMPMGYPMGMPSHMQHMHSPAVRSQAPPMAPSQPTQMAPRHMPQHGSITLSQPQHHFQAHGQPVVRQQVPQHQIVRPANANMLQHTPSPQNNAQPRPPQTPTNVPRPTTPTTQPSARPVQSQLRPGMATPNQPSRPAVATPVQQPRPTTPQSKATPAQPAKPQGFVTELWVVRHGETPENKTRTIAGQNASGLTPNGAKQASLLAERLRGMRFHSIFLSDLVRTKQTADPVLKALPQGIPAFTDTRLREKGAGQYEGFKIGYIEQMTRYSGLPHRVFRPPGGESWEDVAARSRSFMRDMLDKHCICTREQQLNLNKAAETAAGHTADSFSRASSTHSEVVEADAAAADKTRADEVKKILIITHGGFISEFLSAAVGGIGNSSKNCSLSVLCIQMTHVKGPPKYWMRLINDVEHLANIDKPLAYPSSRQTPPASSAPSPLIPPQESTPKSPLSGSPPPPEHGTDLANDPHIAPPPSSNDAAPDAKSTGSEGVAPAKGTEGKPEGQEESKNG
eukprot:CAMPEP_0181301480 /NCGR_PEP_ID=MMETSP1101-20121128/7448_1 /TAXON_ID=46948 /ORGANISM="Rhodomonas abbreviata, Strain Caron Lab Isolate" /LENGTH=515 /DNA_ID=CAMNT_0023406791 /DNA_START=313 /DNA_END=1857 /DNA_ORIENTATION=-